MINRAQPANKTAFTQNPINRVSGSINDPGLTRFAPEELPVGEESIAVYSTVCIGIGPTVNSTDGLLPQTSKKHVMGSKIASNRIRFLTRPGKHTFGSG